MRIVVDVPKAQARRVLDAFCEGRYQERVPHPDNPDRTIKNPLTRVQYVEQLVSQYVNQVVVDAERAAAAEKAQRVAAPPIAGV